MMPFGFKRRRETPTLLKSHLICVLQKYFCKWIISNEIDLYYHIDRSAMSGLFPIPTFTASLQGKGYGPALPLRVGRGQYCNSWLVKTLLQL